MAVLHLILQGNSAARGIPELAPVITKHNDWIAGKKFLLVPYHMIGSADMESGILGGYVEFIRRAHPDAPIPGVYLAEGLFRDAENLRKQMGDDRFFDVLGGDHRGRQRVRRRRPGVGRAAVRGGDRRATGVGRALAVDQRAHHQVFRLLRHPGRRPRRGVPLARQGAVGHEQARGRPGLRRLDSVSRRTGPLAGQPRGRLKFVHQEGQKLAKLVEAQTPDRPVPVISFVARQRDLSELIGDAVPAPTA